MTQIAVWNGSEVDLYRLQVAIQHHCGCALLHATCEAHRLLTDQNVLNHLAFASQIRERVITEEWE
jgi:hypothetical protein